MSFFEVSTSASNKPQSDLLIAKCGACRLDKGGCVNPKMGVSGQGRKGILLVGTAPGVEDDRLGDHFGDTPGRLLSAVLSRFDVDLKRDCWSTNALICKLDRKPDVKEIDYCRPNLLTTIKELGPRIIIVLGDSAMRSVLGHLWNENIGEHDRWPGWAIPSQKINAWVCPTWHPLDIIESREQREGPVTRLWWERHLERAVGLRGKPWEKIPNYEKDVRVIIDPNQAAEWVREKIRAKGAVSFDFETNCLKPHNPQAELVSCSVCWMGRETIAYPWVGDAVTATSELLQSDVPKIGANEKFEESWSRVFLGHGVQNWQWDVVQSAHNLDCREKITSVKFQSFVRLGNEDWGSRIKPYLESIDDTGINRIRQVDLRSLLLYNGVDSLVEFLVARDQKKESQSELW